MSDSTVTLSCFPVLIYVNSTCRLRDKAFNTGDRNFLAYPLWKYFDGKSRSVLLLNNIPALHRWGFCKADLQIVKFFTGSIYSRELRSGTVKTSRFKTGTKLFPCDELRWKNNIPMHDPHPAWLSSLSYSIRCKIHSRAQNPRAKRNKQRLRKGAI